MSFQTKGPNCRLGITIVVLLLGISGTASAQDKPKRYSAVAVSHPVITRITSQRSVFDEVEGIVARRHATWKNAASLSPELSSAIYNNPDFVVVCLVVAEARSWPGIARADEDAKDVEKRILVAGERDSKGTVKQLHKLLEERAIEQTTKEGHALGGGDLADVYYSHRATFCLFIDLPLAEKLGKERQFATRNLEGDANLSKDWYEPELSWLEYNAWIADGWQRPVSQNSRATARR